EETGRFAGGVPAHVLAGFLGAVVGAVAVLAVLRLFSGRR
ncbi:GlsB/YeaQ/YmgE family stress response membrane protein, partial [Mesorhizobium sp. M2D.F.Ca.ET.153.01.1.1]